MRRIGTGIALLALPALLVGCTVFAETHGPTFGVALEIDHEPVAFSPRLQIGYGYDVWNGLFLGWGAGAGLGVSLLEPKVELYAEGRGYVFPFPVVAGGGVIAYSADHGWSGGVRGGGSIWPSAFFWPPSYCSMGVWEQTRDEPCPPEEYSADDTVYPPWLPHVDYRISVYWPLDGGEPWLSHQALFEATIAWFRYGGEPPGPVVDYGER